MSTKITWSADSVPDSTSYTVERSVDGGFVYALLATIPALGTDPHYDVASRQFFYVDESPSSAALYRIVAYGPFGQSSPLHVFTPPAPPLLCRVFGYVRDGFGRADTTTRVTVRALAGPEGSWVNDSSLAGQANGRAVITSDAQDVYPDATGLWQIDIAQGIAARVEIEELDYVYTFLVPLQAGPIHIRDTVAVQDQAYAGLPDGLRIPEA